MGVKLVKPFEAFTLFDEVRQFGLYVVDVILRGLAQRDFLLC
jgi:hypothetical protein